MLSPVLLNNGCETDETIIPNVFVMVDSLQESNYQSAYLTLGI